MRRYVIAAVVLLGTTSGMLSAQTTSPGTVVTTQYLEGVDVRALTRDSTGTIWVGTAEGAYVLEHGGAPARPEVDPTEGIVVNDVVADEAGSIWFCTDEGVIRQRGDEIARINDIEIPIAQTPRIPPSNMDGTPREPLQELGQVMCGTVSPNAIWFGGIGRIVRHTPGDSLWSASCGCVVRGQQTWPWRPVPEPVCGLVPAVVLVE